MDKNSKTKSIMNYSDSAAYLVYVTIAIVYVTLMSLVIDKILGAEELNKTCEYNFKLNMTLEQQEEENVRRQQCDRRREEYQDKYFSHMVIVSIASLLAGGYITTLDGSYNIAGAGVALGGLFGVMYATLFNWYRMTTDLKIIILMISLISLGYGSTLLF